MQNCNLADDIAEAVEATDTIESEVTPEETATPALTEPTTDPTNPTTDLDTPTTEDTPEIPQPDGEEEEYSIITTGDQNKTEPPGPKEAKCNFCKQQFPSKSKLFAHLKTTGHAIKPEFAEMPGAASNKKTKKGKKR